MPGAPDTTSKKFMIPLLLSGGKLWKGSLLAYIIKDEVKRVGYPREGGIQCLCHKEVFSLSDFELHAGSKHKKGSRFIFLLNGSGKSLAMLKEELEVSRHSSRDQSSTALTFGSTHQSKGNTCNICSREGELTFCTTTSCPAAFHAECLPFQIPSLEWYCQKCTCRSCSGPLRTSDVAESHLVVCSQCGDESIHDFCAESHEVGIPLGCDRKSNYYHMGCLLDRGNFCYSLDFKWFCSKDCEKTFEILGKIIELTLAPNDSHPVTVLRLSGDQDDIMFFDDDASTLYTLETRKAAEATRLFATLKLLEKSFMEGKNRRNWSNLFHNMLYPEEGASGSRGRVLNHIGFYTFLLEEGADDSRLISRVISIAIIRIHGNKVAEMPFVATSEPDRGKGYCTKLMDGLHQILKGIEVQYLVVHSPPEFLAMWISKHSLQRVSNDTKRSLLEYNLMKLEGRTLLCKTIN